RPRGARTIAPSGTQARYAGLAMLEWVFDVLPPSGARRGGDPAAHAFARNPAFVDVLGDSPADLVERAARELSRHLAIVPLECLDERELARIIRVVAPSDD
nr:hypothetical protein [Myxococcota bacterium]